MSSKLHTLSRLFGFTAVVFGFICLFSFVHAPKASANACANSNGMFAQINVYVKVVGPNASDYTAPAVGWGRNYNFTVMAKTKDPSQFTNGSDKEILATKQKKRVLGNGNTLSPPLPRAAINSSGGNPLGSSSYNSSVPSQSATLGSNNMTMHLCDRLGSDHPAYDFTDGSNGNPFLDCLGGTIVSSTNISNKYEFTANFFFDVNSIPATYVDNNNNNSQTLPTNGQWLKTSENIQPTSTQDVNQIQGNVVFVYKLPPPPYKIKDSTRVTTGSVSATSSSYNSAVKSLTNVHPNDQVTFISRYQEVNNVSANGITLYQNWGWEGQLTGDGRTHNESNTSFTSGETKYRVDTFTVPATAQDTWRYCRHSSVSPWQPSSGENDPHDNSDGENDEACVTVSNPISGHNPSGNISCSPSGSSFSLNFSFSDSDGTSSNPVKAKINNTGTIYTAAGSGTSGSSSATVAAGSYTLNVLDVNPDGTNNGYVVVGQVSTSSCMSPDNIPDGTISAVCVPSSSQHYVTYTISPQDVEGPTQVKVGTTLGGTDVSGGTLSTPSWTSPYRPNGGAVTYYLSFQNKKPDSTTEWLTRTTTFNPATDCPTLPAVLEPHATVSSSGQLIVGNSVTAQGNVYNSISGTTGNSNWSCSFWFDTNGNEVKDIGETSQPCTPSVGGTGTSFPSGYTYVVTGPTTTIPALTQKVCLSIVLTNKGSNTLYQNGSTSQESKDCQPVKDAPYMKILNGDVNTTTSVSSLFSGGTCTPSATGYMTSYPGQYGTGTELAAYAGNTVTGFMSALLRGSSPTKPAGLTFANSGGAATPFGGTVGCSTDSEWNAAATSGSTTISGYSAGPTRVINGNLFIDGSIIYPTSFTSSAIPTFKVIVTGNIYIKDTVSRIDGIYMAKGTIYTCATTASAPTSVPSSCFGTRLTVNGSLTAPHIKFIRMAGNLTDLNPAETIIYDPTVWLRALNSSGGDQPIDAYTTLPPIL